MKARHKDQVQDHVEDRSGDEVVEGVAAVPHGLKNAVGGVVEHQAQQPGAVDAKIGHRVGHHVLRRAHPGKNGGGKQDPQHAENGQRRPQQQGEDDGGVDGAVYSVLILRAEIPGDNDACPDKHALKKTNDEEAEAPGGGHRRQSGLGVKVAHHKSVYRVIKLLK